MGTHASSVQQADACVPTEIEAGLRSPLHNPASTNGHLATTDPKMFARLVTIAAITQLVRVER